MKDFFTALKERYIDWKVRRLASKLIQTAPYNDNRAVNCLKQATQIYHSSLPLDK